MLPLPFAVQRNGEPIGAYPVRNTVRTGISFGDVRMDFGLVPEFEEMAAAKSQGIPWPTWSLMDRLERAACVAFHRMDNLISMHSQDAVAADSERRARLAQQKGQS